MVEDCLKCKKHYAQSGNCYLDKKICLSFEEELKGKMIRTDIPFSIDIEAETPIIQYNSKVIFEDKGKYIEMVIVKINSLDLDNRICNVTVEYHENEKPYFERKKMFKLLN